MRRSILNRLYNKAIAGLPLLGTPEEMAARRGRPNERPSDTAEKLTGYYTSLCGATGFACGLPGYFTMPITVPSNLAGVAMIQLHLCATVANLAGEDPADDDVRRRCVQCLVTESESPSEEDEQRGVVQRVATKFAERGVRYAGEKTVNILKKTGGARNLPLLGGVISGYSDAQSTIAVSRRARAMFHPGTKPAAQKDAS